MLWKTKTVNLYISQHGSKQPSPHIDSNLLSENFNASEWCRETLSSSECSINIIHHVRKELFKLKKDQMKSVSLDICYKIMTGDIYTSTYHSFIHYVIRDMST